MKFVLRWLHAWAWTTLVIRVVGGATGVLEAEMADLVFAAMLALLFAPGIYLSLRVFLSASGNDSANRVLAALWIFGGSIGGSTVVFGFLGFLASFSRDAPSSMDRFAAALLIHVVGAICIALSENLLFESRDTDF